MVASSIDDGFDALPQLRGEWEGLFLRLGGEPSTSFEWTTALVRHHLKRGDRGFLVRLTSKEGLVGLVPLVLRTERVLGSTLRILRPLSEDYNTHSDLLVDRYAPESLDALVSALFRVPVPWDCFRMARLLEDHPHVDGLAKRLNASGCTSRTRLGLPAYFLTLPKTFDDYLSARSAKFRNHLRRMQKRLHDAGCVAIHISSDRSTLDEGFDALLHVERVSWKHTHGSSISAVTHQVGFYRDLAEGALANGRLHLQWLTLDGEAIAYNLGYVTAFGYHYLKTSYDHSHRQCGPSTVLRAALINELIVRGIPRLDFPGEPYEWETQWTKALRWRVVLSAYGPTVRGRLLAVAERLRHRDTANRRVKHVDPRLLLVGR